MVLKAYAIWTSKPAAAAGMVRAQAAEHRQRLAEYEAIEQRLLRAHAGHPAVDHPDFGSLAAVRYGIGYERHRIEWCKWLANAVERT